MARSVMVSSGRDSGPGRRCRRRRARRPGWPAWACRYSAGIRRILLLAAALLLFSPLLVLPGTRPAPKPVTQSTRFPAPRPAAIPPLGNGDPFSSVRLFTDPDNAAAVAAAAMSRSDPVGASLLRKIASQPTAAWFGGWFPVGQVAGAVRAVLDAAAAEGSMPLLVLYAFPYQGCAQDPAAAVRYEHWIGQAAAGIGTGRAVVILEPDALAEYVRLGCLSPAAQRDRLSLLHRAVDQLASLPGSAVYLDAGNSRWQSASVMASLLASAGVREIRGFSLNVSNFHSTADEESYGGRISAQLGGKHFVIDTSRNGAATARTWCNPLGQALGMPPTANSGDPLVDALLWVKLPGSSDGTCNGGPAAGIFWPAYALGLAADARW
jgi:endoglucanase